MFVNGMRAAGSIGVADGKPRMVRMRHAVWLVGNIMGTSSALSAEGMRDTASRDMAHAIMIYVVALVPTLPVFLILRSYIPVLDLAVWGGFRLDQFIFFLVLLITFIAVVQRFQRVVFGALIAALLALTITNLSGSYGFGDLIRGYAGVMGMLRTSASDIPLASGRFATFQDAFQLQALVENAGPEVRKAAVKMATAHFASVQAQAEDHTLVQCFSVFKEINSSWRYVSDRKGGEYFAPPAESHELMAGDCDDHAVLMAACIKAVGGEVRLVRTDGHVYPELRIGDDVQLERATVLIREKLFRKQARRAPLHHHTDADGVHWINLDYTRPYPGGELVSERILGILEL
jgi:hypothetical protein